MSTFLKKVNTVHSEPPSQKYTIKGQYPNQNLNKITFSVGGEMTWKNFKMDASAAYNKRVSTNDHGSGYSGSYIYDMVTGEVPNMTYAIIAITG